jgi:glutamine amidotransferase-like uncharacterized protein
MKKPILFVSILISMTLIMLLMACSPASSDSPSDNTTPLPDTSVTDPSNSNPNQQSPPSSEVPTTPANPTTPMAEVDVLLFNGQGISTSDWQNTEKLVQSLDLTYQLVNSAQMNAMSLDGLSKFGVLIFPGGTRGGIMSGLTDSAQLNLRQAVRDRGVSYLGFCAGSFAAVGTLADTNTVSEKDLAVVKGTHLSNWWPNGDTSLTAAIVPVTFADGSSRSLVWWGGPSTPEWTDGVIARYANGKPAISQTFYQKGFVVLTGPHPEAPQGWRNTAGADPDGLDYELAKQLIQAALNRSPLPAN